MKRIFLLVIVLTLSITTTYSQSTCAGAAPFCTASGTTFPASTGTTAPAGPNYGCLGSEPNPAWYYLNIATSGNINIDLSNSAGVDIDFCAWGPFSSQAAMCPGTSNSPFDCSYSTAATEQVNIVGAVAGQWYMVLITNYANVPTNISATTAAGSTGSTNCAILCNMTGLTAVPGPCNPATNQYSVTGTITTTTPPSTGTLTVTSSCGGSVVLSPPFATSINYTIPGITSTGGACSITATYSADPTCTLTQGYTSPAPCTGSCTATASNTGPYCAGATIQLNSTPSGGTAYSWAGPGGFTSSVQNPTIPSATPAMTGTYSGTVTSGGSTCTATTSVTVNANPTVTVNSPTICACSSILLNGAGATSYSWSTGATSASITVSPCTTQTFTVTGTSSCCTATAVSTVTVNPIPVTTSTSVTICPGSSGTLNGGGATSYTWSTGALTPSMTDSPAITTSYTVTGTSLGCSSTAVGTITVGAALVANAGPDDTVCFGGSTTLTVTPNGAGYSYNWAGAGLSSTSVFNPTATPASTTDYTVTLTDAGGCTATDIVQVFVDPQVNVAVGSIPALCNGACNGQTIVIPSGGTPSYTYNWSSGCTGTSCSSLCAGSYSVTVTDAMGCTATGSTTVTEPSALSFTTSSTTSHCNLPDGSATVTPSGGTPSYTFLWPDGQTTPTASNLIPGTYCCTVTDGNGCSDTACVTVPNTPGVVASISGQTAATCNGACDGTATAAGSAGVSPYTYSWNTTPVQTTAVATGLCAGTYICTVTDASGCTDTASVIISEPTLVVIAPITSVTICASSSATLTASASGGTTGGYTYNWMPGAMATASVTVTPSSTTNYTVTATDINGCPAAAVNVTVTVNPSLSLVPSAASSICPGASATISAIASNGNGGPYMYNWMPGGLSGASQTVSPGTTTTYTVTADDGCSPTIVDSVTVTVLPLPTVLFTSTPPAGCTPWCVNFTDLSSVSGGGSVASWSWAFSDGTTDNVQNPSHCFTNPQSYDIILTATSSAGCVNTLTMPNYVTVYPPPVAGFVTPVSVSIVDPVVQVNDLSSGANSWLYDFGDTLSPTNTSILQNPTYTYNDTGTYTITQWVTSINGCIDSIIHYVIVDPEFTFFIPNAFSPNDDGINDEFFGKGDFITDFEMSIYDRWGNLIFFTDDLEKHWKGKANHGPELAQQDVYVYVVKLKDLHGKKHKYIGSVTIVK